MLERGGVVYGAALNKKFKTEHIRVERIEQLEQLQGVKYVQSDLGNCLEQMAALLQAGKDVLFVGTPCQISAVKNAMDCPNLLTGDLLCQGVPSKKLFVF